MICGALQTLNEEAFEDVIGSERPSPTGELLAQHDMLHTQTFTPHHLSQTGKQSQLEPIKEGTEHCTDTPHIETRRASHGFINNLLNSFAGLTPPNSHNNNSNKGSMSSVNTTANGGIYTSILDGNHGEYANDPVPTVIVMPSSFDSANDDTHL